MTVISDSQRQFSPVDFCLALCYNQPEKGKIRRYIDYIRKYYTYEYNFSGIHNLIMFA